MKKSILLLAAGSMLLSGCDLQLVAPAPVTITTWYSFTKAALDKCGSFQGSTHTITTTNRQMGRVDIDIVARHGLFIGAKRADGTREVTNYDKVDWSLPDSQKMKIEEVGTYNKSVSMGASTRGSRYDISIKCGKTGEVLSHTAKKSSFEQTKKMKYYIDVKDGKLTIDLDSVPERDIFDLSDGSSIENVKYYFEELYPINIP